MRKRRVLRRARRVIEASPHYVCLLPHTDKKAELDASVGADWHEGPYATRILDFREWLKKIFQEVKNHLLP